MLGSTRRVRHNFVVAHHKVDGGALPRNKKIQVDDNLLSTQPDAAADALLGVRTRVVELLEELPHGGAARIAEKLGVKPERLSNWKKKEVPLTYLPLLPEAFGINGHWLLTGKGDKLALPGEADQLVEAIRLVLDPAEAEAEERLEMVEYLRDRLGEPPPEEGAPPLTARK